MRRITVITIMLLGVLIPVGPVFSENQPVDDLRISLNEILEGSGCTPVYTGIGELRGTDREYWGFELDPGTYRVVAGCTEEGALFELRIFDDNHTELTADSISKPIPMRDFVLDRAQVIHVELTPVERGTGGTADYVIVVASIDETQAPKTDFSDVRYPSRELKEYWDEWIMQNDLAILIDGGATLEDETDESFSFTHTIEPGTYHSFASSVDESLIVQMVAYNDSGEELADCNVTDEHPVLVFTLTDQEIITIEIIPDEPEGEWPILFAFLLAAEPGGEIFHETGREIDFVIESVKTYAAEQGYGDCSTGTGGFVEGDSIYWGFELDPGNYMAWAACTDDEVSLELRINHEDRDESIISMQTGLYPTCRFEIESRQVIWAELIPLVYGSERTWDYAIVIGREETDSIETGGLHD